VSCYYYFITGKILKVFNKVSEKFPCALGFELGLGWELGLACMCFQSSVVDPVFQLRLHPDISVLKRQYLNNNNNNNLTWLGIGLL